MPGIPEVLRFSGISRVPLSREHFWRVRLTAAVHQRCLNDSNDYFLLFATNCIIHRGAATNARRLAISRNSLNIFIEIIRDNQCISYFYNRSESYPLWKVFRQKMFSIILSHVSTTFTVEIFFAIRCRRFKYHPSVCKCYDLSRRHVDSIINRVPSTGHRFKLCK